MLPIIKRVAETIDRYAMFSPNDHVLVGVSGGPDSVALLKVLHSLAGHYSIKLAAAHLDHGLRPQAAEKETAHVSRLADGLKLDLHYQRIELDSTAGSIEERARKARYAFFNRLADRNGYTRIALAHHTDDNAEAVLLHLLRGSGIRGLAGIPPVRGRRIVRPFIHLRRAEILDYLQARDISYMRDTSNDDLRFERNRIRHRLIPFLEASHNPNIVETLQRTADLCYEEEQWLQSHLTARVDDLVAGQSELTLELHVDPLRAAPLALQRRLIRDALRRWKGHLRRMGVDHIDAIIAMLPAKRRSKRISLPNHWQVERTPNHLRFSPDQRSASPRVDAPPAFEHVITPKDHWPLTIDIPQAEGRLHFRLVSWDRFANDEFRDHVAHFDLDQLIFPLIIRNFLPGDRIRPFGMHGSQKLKKLFSHRKIPQHQRKCIPLLVCNSQIIWVAGVRRGRGATVSKETDRVLEVQWRTTRKELPGFVDGLNG